MTRRAFTISSLLAAVAAPSLMAHHSTAMYDMANPTTITGTVKKFDWVNPHAFITVEVKDEAGKLTEWSVELMSLNHLRGYGWTRKTVQPGEVISCTGGAARSGVPAMISSFIKLADGRMIKS